MRSREQRLSDILLHLYEAALDPEHWTSFLEQVTHELGASKAALHVHYFDSNDAIRTANGSCAVAIGYEASALEAYATQYAREDIYVQRIREYYPVGIRAGTTADLMATSELRNTEIYHEFCRPNGVFYNCWSAFHQDNTLAAGLGVIRPETAKPFDASAVDFLNLLNPHMAKAFRLQRGMESLRSDNEALRTTASRFEIAVIALDQRGRVVSLSEAAKGLLDREDGVRIRRGYLELSDRAQNCNLAQRIAAAAQPLCPAQPCLSSAILVPRKHGAALQMAIFPFLSTGMLVEDHPSVIVFLSDPSSAPSSRGQLLQEIYGLTPTECRLADLLLEGLEVKQAAERLRITLETARFHLKRVLAKTGARRQTELMRRMLALPASSSDRQSGH